MPVHLACPARHLRSTLMLFALLATTAAGAAPNLELTDKGAEVSGLSPGARVAWLFAGRSHEGYVSRVGSRDGLATDRDGDGRLEMALGHERPEHTLWAAVDLASGEVLLESSGPAARFEELALRGRVELGEGGKPSRLRLPVYRTRALWVRPGVGAWALEAADAGPDDADGVGDGHLTLSLPSLAALDSAAETPGALAPGDLLLLFDVDRLLARVARVAAADLPTADLPTVAEGGR